MGRGEGGSEVTCQARIARIGGTTEDVAFAAEPLEGAAELGIPVAIATRAEADVGLDGQGDESSHLLGGGLEGDHELD